ncbi:MAG: signal peptide peptidase SppA [Ignavibacteria bacterium]|nr:signal peptide peptidase SppA [Ignavibacteria bacterium]
MRLLNSLLVLIFFNQIIFSQTNFPYQASKNFFPTSSGAWRFGLNGFDNPALLTYIKEPDIFFIWNNSNKNYFQMDKYGIFTGFKNFGFAYYYENLPLNNYLNSFKISSSFGDRNYSFGFAYQWFNSNISNLNPKYLFALSSLFRPNKFISFGLVTNFDRKFENYEGIADLAIRPFGNEKLTLFGDYVYSKVNSLSNSGWSSGIVIEPFEGISFIGRYFNSKIFSLGVNISFGRAGLFQTITLDKNGESLNQIQGIRVGSYDKNITSKFIKKEKSHTIDLNGQIKYQKFQFFDKSKTLLELIDKLEKIKNDPTIKQIEINTSGMFAPNVFLWELRDKLAEVKSSGKKIIIFIDNANISIYHFASIADKIVMDPLGLITLEGVLLGRNFYKGTLEKLGLGFDELRFFKYKSAAETYSREKMSDADREQRQLIVDNLYNTIKSEIENSRKNLKLPFDTLVNNYVVFNSQNAIEFGLIDSVGRWYEIKDKFSSKNLIKIIRDNSIEAEVVNDFSWGEKPKIAVVYVLGACAMDEGIKARTLIKEIEKISNDNSIKAVVFRIDSPGGDALASDVIAEGMKKLKKKIPVIVSQGSVAGSGGYWLSMYADTIVSNKNTITGSIGVIGSWIYNKGFKESAGVSTDYVKRGEHADLGFGMIIPILNVTIPDRKLTNEERTKIELMIKDMYKDFVKRVADGRNKTTNEIEQVAQGRVWSGIDAKNLGLVDLLGGLKDAIEVARLRANLPKDEFQIVEFPKPQLLDLSLVIPISFESKLEKNSFINHLRFKLNNNGRPMMLMPEEFIPEDYFILDYLK